MIEAGTSLEKLLDQYLEAKQAQEEVEAFVKQLGASLLDILEKEDVKEKFVSGHKILKVVRTTFKTTLVQARVLKATETVEQVNKAMLKQLHQQGVEVPGVTTTAYVQVTEEKAG
jgi:hypothetical protein